MTNTTSPRSLRTRAWLCALCALAALLTLAPLSGCAEDDSGPNYKPIDRQTATAQANLYISAHALGTASSAAFLDQSPLARASATQISAFSSASTSTTCWYDEQDVAHCDDTSSPDDSGERVPLDMTSDADEMARWFADHVFNDARVTSAEATRLTFTLAADLFCQSSPDDFTDPSFPAEPSAVDGECVAAFTRNPAQIELRALSDDLLQATLVIGSARPLTVTLSPTTVSAELDLAATQAAAQTLGTPDAADLFEGLSVQGRVKVEVSKLGDRHYRAALKVSQAVRVTGDVNSGARFNLSLQPSEVTVEANGDARTVAFDARVGSLDLDMPFSSDDASPDTSGATQGTVGTLSVHLDGASARAAFTGDQDSLLIEDVSLGQSTSTVKLNGQSILSIDLNPTMGRALSVALRGLSDGAGDIIEATFTPGLHLKLLLALQNASNVFGGEVPAWGRNETLEVRFDGAPAPTLQLRHDATHDLKVLAGRLSFSATSLPSPVVFEAGQCVSGLGDDGRAPTPVDPNDPLPTEPTEPTDDSDAHPFSRLAPVACE